jgi:hypothetical protein
MPNGDLIAGGTFSSAGGTSANGIARWNGSAWLPLAQGLASPRALAVMANGDLVAGGDFTGAGGISAIRVARWNGTAWSSMPPGMNLPINALTVLPNGDLIAGGRFTSLASGGGGRRIARWDGSTWVSLGVGVGDSGTTDQILALTALPSGDVMAGGTFTLAGGAISAFVAQYSFGAAAPVFDTQQHNTTACADQDALLSVSASSAGTTSFRWQLQTATSPVDSWVDLSLGSRPLPCGGGASIAAAMVDTPVLSVQIHPCPGDPTTPQRFLFRCVATNPCGSTTSAPVACTICPADFDCSGNLAVGDIFTFLNAWFASDPRANFNGIDGISVQDIFDYLNAWFTGC